MKYRKMLARLSRRSLQMMLYALSVCACSDAGSPLKRGADGSLTVKPMGVIGGARDPGEIGYLLTELEQNAVVAQRVMWDGAMIQSCTGTVVGDRLVASAAHCMIMNREEWFHGATLQIFPPQDIEFVVGEDIQQPLCTLKVETVHLSPEINYMPSAIIHIEHDAALVLLKESIISTCPHLMPAQINRESLGSLMGQQLLQGGFGSLDDSKGHSSPIRYWSAVEVRQIVPLDLVVVGIGKGFPSYGDSGSGVLHRSPDGALRNLGVSSQVAFSATEMAFARLDVEEKLFSTVLNRDVLCGPVDERGICIQDSLVTCNSDGFHSIDCETQKMSCALDDSDKPVCRCSCDRGPYCEETCACDPQCPCTCDVTSSCDAGCSCDSDCYQQTRDAGPSWDAANEPGGGCSHIGVPYGADALLPILLFLLAIALLNKHTAQRTLLAHTATPPPFLSTRSAGTTSTRGA